MQRRALLRTCGLTGLAGLSGCAGLIGNDSPGGSSEETVNPELQGTPTVSGDAAWSTEVSNVYDITGVGSTFLVSIPTESDSIRYHAFDARSGTEKWQTTETLPTDSYAFDIGDVLLAESDSGPGQADESNSLAAIDPETGSILWRRDGAAFVDAIGDGLILRELVTDGESDRLVVVDRRTGRERWTTAAPERSFRLAREEVVTLTRGSKTGISVDTATTGTPSETTPTETPSETATTGTVTETATTTAGGTRTPAATEDRPYRLRGRSPQTGEIRWRVDVPSGVEDVFDTRLLDDRILLLEEFGDYLVVDTAAGTVTTTASIPKELSTYRTARRDVTAYFGDWTYRGTTSKPGYLTGIDLADGSAWTREFPTATVRPVDRPTLGNRWVNDVTADVPPKLYANHIDDRIETVAHDPGDGTVEWRREAVTVSVDERGPLVTQPGAVVALDGEGGERWRSSIPFEGRVTNGLGAEDGGYAFRRGPILFLSTDAGLASYDITDGTRRQSITSTDLLDAEITGLADRTVAFVRDGRLRAYHF